MPIAKGAKCICTRTSIHIYKQLFWYFTGPFWYSIALCTTGLITCSRCQLQQAGPKCICIRTCIHIYTWLFWYSTRLFWYLRGLFWYSVTLFTTGLMTCSRCQVKRAVPRCIEAGNYTAPSLTKPKKWPLSACTYERTDSCPTN